MHIRRILSAALILCIAAAAWAQQAKSVGEVLEGKVKQASLHYYLGMALGDVDEYLRGTRLPLQTLRNGKAGSLDEAAARNLLKAVAARQAQKPLTKDERTQVIGSMIRALDEADIRFIGANTASIVFVLREDPATKAASFCSLTLYRQDPKAGDWKVIQETTDSDPVPADYVK